MSRRNNRHLRIRNLPSKKKNKQKVKFNKYDHQEEIISHFDLISSIVNLEETNKEICREIET